MKTALVTGAAGGIGKAISARLSAAGYQVAMLDLKSDAATEAAASVPGSCALFADVTDEHSVARALEDFGIVPDLLVNNAGVATKGGLLDQPLLMFRRTLDINLVGALVMARAVVPGMIARGSGAIVNITSIAAVQANVGGGAYGPAKAGLCNLTQVMALEWADHGIRVNAVAPGLIDAGMATAGAAFPDVLKARRAMVPQGRLGTADDVADVVMFLGSEAAGYVTGQQLLVDGGLAASVIRKLPAPPAST